MRAFLYAGPRLATSARSLGNDAFARELNRYATVLRATDGILTYAAISPAEVAADGSVSPFVSALGPSAPGGSVPPGTPAPLAGSAAYVIGTAGSSAGPVRVIVLDWSQATLPEAQLGWLAAQLDAARASAIPAIVLGSADLGDAGAANHATNADAVISVLSGHGASAYLFSSREKNVQQTLGAVPRTVPAFGSGTLGYVDLELANSSEFLGESGFLLASVDVARRDPATNVAPVTASLIPNAGELALESTDGTLLRRSSVSLFKGLARRPIGGSRLEQSSNYTTQAPDPYIPIPNQCVGVACGQRVPTAYRFSSSRSRHRRLRRARSQLDESARRAAGERRQPDRGRHLGAVLRVQQRDDDSHDRRGRTELLAAGESPARLRPAAVRHRAAERSAAGAGRSGRPARRRAGADAPA